MENINNETEYKQGWRKDLLVGFLAGIFFIVFGSICQFFFGSGVFDSLLSYFKTNDTQFLTESFIILMLGLLFVVPSMLGIAVGRHFFLKRGYGADSIYILPQIFPFIIILVGFFSSWEFLTILAFIFLPFQIPFFVFASAIVHISCQEIPRAVKISKIKKLVIRFIFFVIVIFSILAILGIIQDAPLKKQNKTINQAIETKNVDACYNVEKNEGRLRCIKEVAIAKKDATLCERIPKDDFTYDDCYINIAIDTRNPDLCEILYEKVGRSREECLGRIKVTQKMDVIKKEIFPLFEPQIRIDETYFLYYSNSIGYIYGCAVTEQDISNFYQYFKKDYKVKVYDYSGIKSKKTDSYPFCFYLTIILDEEKN